VKESDRYVKIVEWSEEDQCYVGSSPGLMFGGCHGEEQQQVFQELCGIVEEIVELYRQEGRPLPPPTGGRDLVNALNVG
jgi:predicted RNase H-like HicB family nuclease